jgi:hypothetical protein
MTSGRGGSLWEVNGFRRVVHYLENALVTCVYLDAQLTCTDDIRLHPPSMSGEGRRHCGPPVAISTGLGLPWKDTYCLWLAPATTNP